jgi:hypothetical protein
VTAADKPRADLVALFDAFAMLPPGNASLSLHGSQHEAEFRAWAVDHGQPVEERQHRDGEWTALGVRVASGTITVHLDAAPAPTAQADQQVLARVQAALDGDCTNLGHPEACDSGCDSSGPLAELADLKQPEAAEGGV